MHNNHDELRAKDAMRSVRGFCRHSLEERKGGGNGGKQCSHRGKRHGLEAAAALKLDGRVDRGGALAVVLSGGEAALGASVVRARRGGHLPTRAGVLAVRGTNGDAGISKLTGNTSVLTTAVGVIIGQVQHILAAGPGRVNRLGANGRGGDAGHGRADVHGSRASSNASGETERNIVAHCILV